MAKRGRPRVERVQMECAACGAKVERYPAEVSKNKSGRFFCSGACRAKIGSKPRRRLERTCEQCGEQFYPDKKPGARFCSKGCYDRWQARDRVERTCEQCGAVFDRPPSWETRQKARFCSRSCEAASRIKRALDRMHNGKPAVVDSAGYVRVYEPEHPGAFKSGWMPEHRLVAERVLGRRLERAEHVHHINGVKDDNRPENLVVLGHGEHSSLTGLARSQRQQDMERQLAAYRERFGPLED